MKKIYILCLGIFLAFGASSQVVIDWSKTYGSTGIDYGNHIELTSDGGYIIAGHSNKNNGDVSGVHDIYNKKDMWVLKLDSMGNIQWQKALGGTLDEEALSIVESNDGGFAVIGYSKSPNDGDVSGNMWLTLNPLSSMWIVKLDSIGNIIWNDCYGGILNEIGYSILATSDTGFIACGSATSNNFDVTGNHGSEDFWVIKIDKNGILEWQKCYGGGLEDIAYNISKANGGYIVTGSSKSSDGDVSLNHGGLDFWVIKIDTMGNLLWEKSLGGSGTDYAQSVISTNDGGFLVIGSTNSNDGDVSMNYGGYDFWVVKLDSSGTLMWEKTIGGLLNDEAYDIVEDDDNNILLIGRGGAINSINSQMFGQWDGWIIVLDSIGNLLGGNPFGGSGDDFPKSIKKINSKNYIVAGTTFSNDGDILSNNGLFDVWVLKLVTDFNSIKGSCFADLNNNFIYDIGDLNLNNHLISEINTGRFAISNANGFYHLSIFDTGNFSVSTSSLLHYSPMPSSHSAFFTGMYQTDSLNNFAFQPNGVINDLQVIINPVGAFRPGFNAYYYIHYKNVGTTSLSGSVIFKPDSILTYVSSLITPTSITSDSVTWNIPTLNPFDEGNILVTVNVSTGAVLGSSVNSIARIEPVSGDAIPTDNESTWGIIVTGSYDPNDILVNRETVATTELISPPYLDYLIRFQNTGTDTAFTVKIKNPLPVNAQLNTFEFLESSHPVQLNYSNPEQVMWFQFDNILLPDSNINELLSHGYVRYRIKPKSTLVVGDLLENSASIFFDFNAPIYTNTAVTEIVLPTFVPGIKNNFDFSIFPNPSTGEVNISFTLKEEKEIKIELYNSLGQLVKIISQQKFIAGKNQINFSTENLSKGIYHIKFSVDDNVVTRKFVKM